MTLRRKKEGCGWGVIFHCILFCNFSYLVHVLSQLKKKILFFSKHKHRDCWGQGPWLSHMATLPSSPHAVSSSAHVASIYLFICVQYRFLKYIFELEHTLLLYISQQWQLSKLFSLDASPFSPIPSLMQANYELFFHFCHLQWENNIPTARHAAASENSQNRRFLGKVHGLCVWLCVLACKINYSGDW